MRIPYFIFILFVVSSCKITSPTFQKIEHVKFEKIGAEGLRIGADVIFNNPNNVKCKIQDVQFDVLVDGKKIGSVGDKTEVIVSKKSDFTVPISLNFKPEGKFMDLLKTALNIFQEKKAEIFIQGEVKIKAYGFKFGIPVKQKKTVPVKLF